MFSYATNWLLVFTARHAPDFVPIFFPYIIIDFDCPGIEMVAALVLAAGHPIVFAGLPVEIVCFESASRECMESATFVVHPT